MNGHLGLIHSILPATADLHASIPEDHPSARNLGTERQGSGTIVDSDGYILTVHYVVSGATAITVTLVDGDQYPGEIAGLDPETGLALVRIPARSLPCLKAAPPESITLGQAAVIVASNGQNERKVGGGYITSMEPYDGHWEYMLDKTICLTAVNPGLGGGTLADFKGRLIGVVSLNLSTIGKFTLAIPIEYYLRYEQELKQYGRVISRPKRAWLGFYPQPMAGHIVVGGVVPGGPAERCGLREGDIILGVENVEIRSRRQLYQEIWKKRPGERISFRVLRSDSSFRLDIVGGDRWERDKR
ncbi:MAG TPA: trypsin-like peptidase domain-containing protein [candidate division Zixibacteria bacterium]|nr:trypsin-like peptidase domain-containing protein [candidate division Zixibacteria bacterium]